MSATNEGISSELDRVIERIRANFTAKHAAREQALTRSRDAIRHAALTIRAIHRGDTELARSLLEQCRVHIETARAALAGHPDIYFAGFIHDAQKEYAEASITSALIQGLPLPAPEALGVENAAYLNGLGEAVGELRRYLLDGLRHGDLSRSERLLAAMDDIYAVMVTIDFPDAITGGLRRTTDVTRGILEKTRGDLTVAARQQQLEERLAAVQQSLQN